MRIWALGTSSAGNAFLLESEGARVLVDAGFAPRTLAARLAAVGAAPESVEAVVLTHEHADHARGAADGAARWGWRILASHGTVDAHADLAAAGARRFRAGDELALNTMTIATIPIAHDAAEPVALVATGRRSGTRIGIAYDLGHATEPLARALARLDVLVIEANHDQAMLRDGPYPAMVRARIAGPNGHLSNRAAAELAACCVHRELAAVVLAHLSARCNSPALAVQTVGRSLVRARSRATLAPAPRAGTAGPFGPDRQMELGFR